MSVSTLLHDSKIFTVFWYVIVCSVHMMIEAVQAVDNTYCGW